jgi:tetratricopeptide (TPR) repeat protein
MSYPIRKSPLRLSRFRLSLPLLGLIAIAFSGSAFASGKVFQGGFTILGSVSLADGKPAPYFKVKISGMTGLNFEVQTTDQGRYQFFNIPNGRYRLTAYDPADSTTSSEATEADTSRAGGNRLIVHLYIRSKPIAKSESKTGVVSVTEATQQIPKEAKKAYEQGVKLKADKKLDQALENFDRAVRLFPEYFQALTGLGEIRIAQNQSAAASEDFARALQYNEEYAPALRGAGYCKLEQQQFEDAIKYLERAIAVEPNVANTHLFLGIANLSLDRREAAERALQQALKLDADHAVTAHIYLADLYARQQQFREAADELRIYLKARPNAPNAAKLKVTEAELRARAKPN